MARNLTGIDHPIVAVRDLDVARHLFSRLGFTLTPLGRHGGRGTGNHCLMFPDAYVELLSVVDPSQPVGDVAAFLDRREGPYALALNTADPDATHDAWAAVGLDPEEVTPFSRRIPPNTQIWFNNVGLDPARTGGLPLFACRTLDPELLRAPAWLEHNNGATGVAGVTVVSAEPRQLVDPLAAVFGPGALTETDEVVAVHTGRGVILIVQPDDLESLHPDLEGTLPDTDPALVVLSITVRDLETTAAVLAHGQVPHRRGPGRRLTVGPPHAGGALLEFVAARERG